jgi:hypothetical protein
MHRKLAQAILSLQNGIKSSSRPDDRKLAAEYMAALAPILASVVVGTDVLADIKNIDRLFGQTWLRDTEPFRHALEHWSSFREEYRRFAFGGMTTNERLFADGQLDTFERAEAIGNFEQMELILRSVYLDEPSIKTIIENAEEKTGRTMR